MFSKIVSAIKKIFPKKGGDPQGNTPSFTIQGGAIIEFAIQINEAGEFIVAATCFDSSPENAHVTATALHLLNTGHLGEYFIESLQIASEGDTSKIQFTKEVLGHWRGMFEEEYVSAALPDEPAVHPKDVFSPFGMP